jgi:hypothetical protein
MAQLIDTPSQTHTDIIHFYTEQEYLQKERSLAKEEKHYFS